MKHPHIVVIGGGMAGTGAAHWLRTRGYKVTIVEQRDYLGGRIHSANFGSVSGELGAAFLTNFYTNTLALIRETNLREKLVRRGETAYIARGGVPHKIDSSLVFDTGLLSIGAKLQLAQLAVSTLPAWRAVDLHAIWKTTSKYPQSVAGYCTGRYGQELLDNAISVALDSYFFWAPESTAFAMLLYLIKATSLKKATYVLRGGLQQIPEAAAKGCTVLLEHSVLDVKAKSNSFTLRLHSPKGTMTMQADGIVCATTATAVPRIMPQLTKQQRAFFGGVRYSTTAMALYKTPRQGVAQTYAIAYPRSEHTPLAAVTVQSELSKTADVVKLYASRSDGERLCGIKSDAEVEKLLAAAAPLDLAQARAKGDWRLQRWPEALPEFSTDHFARLRTFNTGGIEDRTMPLVFAGDYLGGPYIEGALTSGIAAAQRLQRRLRV